MDNQSTKEGIVTKRERLEKLDLEGRLSLNGYRTLRELRARDRRDKDETGEDCYIEMIASEGFSF
jgi:hypothetical protein